MINYSITELVEVLDKASDGTNHIMAVEVVELYQELEVYYRSALDKVETKLKIIDRELNSNQHRGRKNSIHQIQKRIKLFRSVVKKLERKNLNYSKENITENIQDFAGLRVICSYRDDIYTLINSLQKHPDVEIVRIKDYLKAPKPSGYQSVHVVIEIPVYFLKETKKMKVEIQFRTIAMDFWASLEHSLRYKNKLEDPILAEKLQSVATDIQLLEDRMFNIRNEIEKLNQN